MAVSNKKKKEYTNSFNQWKQQNQNNNLLSAIQSVQQTNNALAEKEAKQVVAAAKKNYDITPKLTRVEPVKNNNLVDALSYGAQTGANTAISGIKSGALGVAQTAADLVGADNASINLAQQLKLAAARKAQEQAEIDAKFNTNFGGLAKGVSDVTAGAIGMLPTIGAFALTPQGKLAAAGKAAQLGAKAIGFAPLALQAGGGGINQALNEGASLDEAKQYGAMTAAKEIATELPFAGIKYIPGAKNLGEMVAGKVANQTAKKIAGAAADMAGEGAEEALAEIVDPLLQRATYNPDAEDASAKDVAYAALVGGLTAGALNAGIKGAEKGASIVPKLEKVQQNDQNRAFEALHGQKMGQNQVGAVQNAQNRPQQGQVNQTTKHIQNPAKVAQNQKYNAEFNPISAKNIQNKNPMDITPKLEDARPKITLEMSERTFENVGAKNVKAYQQENLAVKPFYQETANNLLADLQEGIKGGRDAGVDPETRNVTTMGGWQRQQSEPIERMLRDGMTYNQIEDGLQRIVEDHGKENTANAKRAELYVDDAVRKGYRSVVEGDVSANRAFAYRGKNHDELLEIMEQLENSFTGNQEQDAAIISEMETVQNLLDGMQQEQGIVRNSRTVEPEPAVEESSNVIVKNVPSESDMPRIQNEYKNSTDESMYDFIDDARASDKTRYYKMSPVSDSEAADIKRLTGIDVTGFARKLSSDTIRHIDNRHGVKGAADSSLKDDADIARVNYVLENYDTIEDGGYNESHAFVDKNNKPAPMVRYSKRVNGTYYVVEAVPDTARKSLQIVTAYKSTKKEASKHVVDADRTNLPQPNVQNAHASDASFVDNIIPENQQEDNTSSDRYQELIDEYGAMPKGENPFGSNRDIEVPKQTNDFDKVRRFNRTAMEAEQTADETVGIMKDKIASDYQDGSVTYEPISNKATLDDANIRINQNGWESEANDFSSAVSKGTRITAEDIAVAERCIQEAQKAGNYEAAANIISDLSIVGTEYGQAIQALSMLKRLSPEGQLKTFLKVQKRINNQLIAQGKKPVMDITPEVQAEFLAAKDTAERDAIWKREIAKAASQTSGTWREKINALRYAAMLSNPKTHIRNMIGNFVMQAAYVPRNIISGALQDVKGGEKTHSLTATFKNKTGNTGKELRDYAQYDLKEYAERALQNIGNRYDDVSGEFESQRRTFGNSIVGRGLEQFAGKGKYSVGSMLDKEDMLFKKLTYKNALIDYMKANGISVADAKSGVTKPNGSSIAKGREYAMEQARKATFTEDNMVASWLSEMEHNGGLAGTITIGSVMPFKKTPLNILSRGVEFSPVGLGMTAYKLAHAVSGKRSKGGKYYDMNDVMDSFGANATGGMILAAGMYLASLGYLETTGDDDDDRKARYDSQMGDQNFAVVNPETGESWTIDWLAPSAMPLLTGVEVYRQLFGDNKDVEEDLILRAIDSASKIADPVFEMSCMQGVASALASYSGDAGDIASSLGANILTGIAGQFIPQPMAAWARTIDDTVRSSYASKENGDIKKTGESFLRQQRSKVPDLPVLSEMGLSSVSNEPSIDVWGNERKREFAGDEMQQVLARTFNSFFNPTTYSSNKRTELDLTLEALYKSTGDSGVLPKSATNYVTVDGTKYHKTPEEKTAYDKTKGQKSKQYVSDFVNSSVYGNLDDTTRADIVADLYDLANYEAKKEMLSERKVWKEEYENSTYEKVLKSGVSPGEYYSTRKALDNKYSYEDAVAILENLESLNMTPEKYLEVMQATSDINSYDANGKSKKGLKKQRIQTKANELGLTAQQANFIYEMSQDNWRMYNIWN